MKKLLPIFLIIATLCSLFGSFAVLAEEETGEEAGGEFVYEDLITEELLVNADLELYGTSFRKWTNSAPTLEGIIVKSGELSVKFSSNKEMYTSQIVKGIIPEKEYTFSAYMYVQEFAEASADVKKGGKLKVEFFDEAGNLGIEESAYFDGKVGEWSLCSITFTAPSSATSLAVSFGFDCGGTIYWDQTSLVGPVTAETYALIEKERQIAADAWAHSCELLEKTHEKELQTQIVPGAINSISNPSFEELTPEGYAVDWTPFQNTWGPVISITDEEAHSGKYSARITGSDATYLPWISQAVPNTFIADATYVLSAWVKAEKLLPLHTLFFKAEFYNNKEASSATYLSSASSSDYQFKDKEWHQIKMVFTMPANTALIKFYLRTSTGDSIVYYDDVELGPVESSNVMEFLPNFTFNYTDVPNVETVTTINQFNNPIAEGNVVEYTVKDGNKVIVKEAVPAASKIVWSFPTEKLAKEGKAYTISAAYKSADGTVLEETEPRRIYRYDRPTQLDKENRIIVDGKPLDVIMLYGAYEEYFDEFAAAGVTVIRPDDVTHNDLDNIDKTRALLDSAHKSGLKVLFSLYWPAAGHPYQVEATKILVKEFKDHPAVVAWMLCDEPAYQVGWMGQSYDEILEYIEEGYRAVRSVDDENAVFVCECHGIPDSYKKTFSFVDIACVDLYPQYDNETINTYKYVKQALESVSYGREVWNLGYGSDWDPKYITDDDRLRLQNYLAVWAGAKAYGYYTKPVCSPAIIETLKKSNDSGEREQLFDHFVRGNSPVFDEYLGNDFWHRSWVTKDGKMYLAVKEHKNNGENTEVKFNLKSANELIEINGFTAKLVNGNTDELITSTDSTFTLTMKPSQVSMYEIIPNSTVDFSKVSEPVFVDLDGFDWAEDAVVTVTKKGIANKKGTNLYAPGENITRGDFAMYLIRTLGIDAETTDQFTDVDPDAEYAKEVAIGKALGILKGSGDGTYNPEESISRQDLMVICARGMRIARGMPETDYATALKTFTDTDLIADYAVNDIGSMVSAKIVTGNADLTINPLGNTTRAEAAVIMSRIAK